MVKVTFSHGRLATWTRFSMKSNEIFCKFASVEPQNTQAMLFFNHMMIAHVLYHPTCFIVFLFIFQTGKFFFHFQDPVMHQHSHRLHAAILHVPQFHKVSQKLHRSSCSVSGRQGIITNKFNFFFLHFETLITQVEEQPRKLEHVIKVCP